MPVWLGVLREEQPYIPNPDIHQIEIFMRLVMGQLFGAHHSQQDFARFLRGCAPQISEKTLRTAPLEGGLS
jgi:hypothetical protein